MIAALQSPAPKKSSLSTPEMLGLVGEIGYLVAVPAVAFGFGGAYLDKAWGTKPWLTIACLAFAILVSTVAVARVVKRVLSEL